MASAQADDFYVATLIGLLGAVEAGITTVVDWCEAVSEEQFSAAAEAHRDSGLRTVLVDTRKPGPSRARDESGPPRAWGALVGDLEPESLAVAREAGLRVHLHAGRTAGSGGSLDGLLGPDVTVIHGSGLEAGWMNAVRTAGASVSLTPASEMAEGAGSPPVQALMDLGIRPGLGVGDERVAPGDMFAQMRALISVQHATYFDLKLAGKGGLPNLLGTRQVIRAGTIDGAEAVGLGPVTGSLEVGKQADIVVLRADRPNIFPINDPIGAVVWGMDTSNIHWVLSGGKALMENGALSADVGDARRRAVSSRDRIGAAASSAGGGTL
jgi:cytosine/adenosine deaminase-related metal-dependent hydrolase